MTPLPPFARFWMICRKPTGPQSRTEPRQRYSSIQDARAAARKLAAETGAQIHILETVETIRPDDTTQRSLL